ncbi:MAG: hypothetical protein ACREIT_04860 [Tepidisphaeraceae bacterium]
MPQRGRHCPFLNRSDDRCAEHFKLDHLSHAYKHCFDRYTACPTYIELLCERRVRLSGAGPMTTMGAPDDTRADDNAQADPQEAPVSGPVIQVTVARRATLSNRLTARITEPARVPAPSGV